MLTEHKYSKSVMIQVVIIASFPGAPIWKVIMLAQSLGFERISHSGANR